MPPTSPAPDRQPLGSDGLPVDPRYAGWMDRALDLAARAGAAGDVPVGAVVVSPEGEVVGEGWNAREVEGDPTAHAEVVALRAAARRTTSRVVPAGAARPGARAGSGGAAGWRLTGHTLVVTLEPCPMCAGALLLARVERVVLGAWDPKAGACGSVWDLARDRRSTHTVEVVGGVREAECAQVLLDFFAGRRLR